MVSLSRNLFKKLIYSNTNVKSEFLIVSFSTAKALKLTVHQIFPLGAGGDRVKTESILD